MISILSLGRLTFPVIKTEPLLTKTLVRGLISGLNLNIRFEILKSIAVSFKLVPIPFSFDAEPIEATPTTPIKGVQD